MALPFPAFALDGEGVTSDQLDAARASATAGGQAFEAGDYATAVERFGHAEELFHAPPHLLFLARAQVKLGQLVEAQDTYLKLVEEQLGSDAPPPFRDAQRDGKSELSELRNRIPSIQIAIPGGGAAQATVTIDDGEPIGPDGLSQPIDVNPGRHVVALRSEGRVLGSQSIIVAEGAQAQLIEMTADERLSGANGGGGGTPGGALDEPDQGPSLVPPLLLGGFGVAALGVGAITGVLALNDAAELKDRCPEPRCPAENESLADSVRSLGTVSTVAFILGGAAVSAGVLWWAIQGGDETPEPGQEANTLRLELGLGASSLGIRGTF